jgi:threonine 3-dehydrogenase
VEKREMRSGACPVVAVTAKAFERDEHPAMIRFEAVRPCQRGGSGELSQHLPVPWATNVDLVEERSDRGVVSAEELKPLERVVVELAELLWRQLAGTSGGRILHGSAIVSPPGGRFGRGRMSAAVETMRAIRKRESGPGLTLDEVPVPTPGPDEVLVRIEAASICGTDLHIQRWDQWSSERVAPPLTLGHELCGTVVATGSAVRDVDEGDYVSAESHVTCGVCFHCRTGKAHMCEQTQILGVDRDGGFADYLAVPAGVVWRNDRSKLPPEIACLQEPFGNAVFATSTQDLAGRAVAVLGCGPVGLFTIAIAKAFGAGRLLASDHVPFRMELARSLGADDVVNVDEVDDVPTWFLEQNEGVGVGVVFEMSGALRAIEDAFGIVRHGGNVVLFGIPGRPATIDIAESLIFKNLTVSAVNGREIWETWYTTRWLLEHGVVDLRPLITAELPLERYEEAFALLESGEACKIVLRPNGAMP